MKTTARFALVLAYIVLLAACGNKGELVLPDRKTDADDNGGRAEQPAKPGAREEG